VSAVGPLLALVVLFALAWAPHARADDQNPKDREDRQRCGQKPEIPPSIHCDAPEVPVWKCRATAEIWRWTPGCAVVFRWQP